MESGSHRPITRSFTTMAETTQQRGRRGRKRKTTRSSTQDQKKVCVRKTKAFLCGQNVQRFLRFFLLRIGGGPDVVEQILHFAFGGAAPFRATLNHSLLRPGLTQFMRRPVTTFSATPRCGLADRIHLILQLHVACPPVPSSSGQRQCSRRCGGGGGYFRGHRRYPVGPYYTAAAAEHDVLLGCWNAAKRSFLWVLNLVPALQCEDQTALGTWQQVHVLEAQSHIVVVVAVWGVAARIDKATGAVLSLVHLMPWVRRHSDPLHSDHQIPPLSTGSGAWTFATRVPLQTTPMWRRAGVNNAETAEANEHDRVLVALQHGRLLLVVDGERVVAYADCPVKFRDLNVETTFTRMFTFVPNTQLYAQREDAPNTFGHMIELIPNQGAQQDRQLNSEQGSECQARDAEKWVLAIVPLGLPDRLADPDLPPRMLAIDGRYSVLYHPSDRALKVYHCTSGLKVAQYVFPARASPRATRDAANTAAREDLECRLKVQIVPLGRREGGGDDDRRGALFALAGRRPREVHVFCLHVQETETKGCVRTRLTSVAVVNIPALWSDSGFDPRMDVHGELLLVRVGRHLLTYNLFSGTKTPIATTLLSAYFTHESRFSVNAGYYTTTCLAPKSWDDQFYALE